MKLSVMNAFCEEPTERQKPTGTPKSVLSHSTCRLGMS
jgi:hypothetical protein